MRAIDQLRDADAGLFDTEEQVIASADMMIGDLQAAVRGVDRLIDAYRQSYREQRRLVRLSDRMQLDLHVANHRLEEQAVRLRELNLELAAEIEQRMQLTEELKRLVITDPLTGLASRRHLFDQAAKEIARADRSYAALSILMFDLDLFKAVNDNYGHAAGDAVLCHFAELCKARFRSIDLVGRIGGEEFVVLLPDTDLEGAALVAERLRQTLEMQPTTVGRTQIAVTVSAGVTQYLSTDMGLDRALQRADAALYDAKNQGRNRIVVRAADPTVTP